MKRKLLLVLFAAAATCFADDASHRKVASDMIDLVNGPAALRTGIESALEPMVEELKTHGAPEGAIRELKEAVTDWANKEIVWDEIKPKLVEIYVRDFTEDELKQLLAFYKTPVGAKALKIMPNLFAEGARIGQEYAESKQESLNARLEKIADKYKDQLKGANAPADTAPEAATEKPAEKPAGEKDVPPAKPEPEKK